MTIRTRLRIGAIASILLMISLWLIFTLLMPYINKMQEQNIKIINISKNINTLNALTYNYFLSTDKSSKNSWEIQYNNVSGMLNTIQPINTTDSASLASLKNDYKEIGNIFSNFRTNSQEYIENLDKSAQTNLLVRLQAISTNILEYAESSRLNMVYRQKLNQGIILGLIALSMGVIVINMWLVLKSMVKPLCALHNGIKELSNGNLNAKIDLNEKNEIGDVSRAFDAMTQKLQETTVSRDLLAKEIEQRKKAEKIKEEFLSMMSHEIKTPLTISKEAVNLVLEKLCGEITPKQEKWLKVSAHNLNILHKMLNNLLDVAKLESGTIGLKKKVVDITSVVNDVISNHKSKFQTKQLSLKNDFPSEKINLCIDSEKIERVLDNLVDNAIEYSENGNIEISINEFDDEIECSIVDNGSGIEEDSMSEIFNKFGALNYDKDLSKRGASLGLSISKDYIEMHNGKMKVESEFGKGSKFSFTLPKTTTCTALEECTKCGIEVAAMNESKLSLLLIKALVDKEQNHEDVKLSLEQIGQKISAKLRTSEDTVVTEENIISIFLQDCDSGNMSNIKTRLNRYIKNLTTKNSDYANLKFNVSHATFPDDAITSDELIQTALAGLGSSC